MSPQGEQWATLPPMVATLRIWRLANVKLHLRSAGACRSRTSEDSISASVTPAPTLTPSAVTAMPLELAQTAHIQDEVGFGTAVTQVDHEVGAAGQDLGPAAVPVQVVERLGEGFRPEVVQAAHVGSLAVWAASSMEAKM